MRGACLVRRRHVEKGPGCQRGWGVLVGHRARVCSAGCVSGDWSAGCTAGAVAGLDNGVGKGRRAMTWAWTRRCGHDGDVTMAQTGATWMDDAA